MTPGQRRRRSIVTIGMVTTRANDRGSSDTTRSPAIGDNSPAWPAPNCRQRQPPGGGAAACGPALRAGLVRGASSDAPWRLESAGLPRCGAYGLGNRLPVPAFAFRCTRVALGLCFAFYRRIAQPWRSTRIPFGTSSPVRYSLRCVPRAASGACPCSAPWPGAHASRRPIGQEQHNERKARPMNKQTTQTYGTTNNAGFPPAPSKARQQASFDGQTK